MSLSCILHLCLFLQTSLAHSWFQCFHDSCIHFAFYSCHPYIYVSFVPFSSFVCLASRITFQTLSLWHSFYFVRSPCVLLLRHFTSFASSFGHFCLLIFGEAPVQASHHALSLLIGFISSLICATRDSRPMWKNWKIKFQCLCSISCALCLPNYGFSAWAGHLAWRLRQSERGELLSQPSCSGWLFQNGSHYSISARQLEHPHGLWPVAHSA